MKKIFAFLTVLFISSVLIQMPAQQGREECTKHKAKKWFKKKEWLGGLNLAPHKTVDVVEFAKQYHANKIYWDKAFAFLKEQDLNALSKGKHAIDGENVFATIQEAATKDFDSTKWESHRKYIDLQYVVSGEERMGVCPVTKATVSKPYDEA